MTQNCDYLARMEDLKKDGQIVYGKQSLPSHIPYKLWDMENDTFDVEKINRLYELFKYNMMAVSKYFKPIWVDIDELLVTTKTLIWDWTSDEELERTANSIEYHGVYFPIFVLPKGYLHNQICDSDKMKKLKDLNLYNSYNGNHRIDAIKYLKKQGRFNKKVLVYEIPPFCEKSCTGFRYTKIDHNKDNELTSIKLENSIIMFHLSYLEDEMKMYNLKTLSSEGGVDIVSVDNYNTAFRIMTEFQNALEPPLTRYYQLYNKLPDGFNDEYFNNYDTWKAGKNMQLELKEIELIAENCIYKNKDMPICNDWLDRKECEKKLCCGRCPENSYCDIICDVILNKLVNKRD